MNDKAFALDVLLVPEWLPAKDALRHFTWHWRRSDMWHVSTQEQPGAMLALCWALGHRDSYIVPGAGPVDGYRVKVDSPKPATLPKGIGFVTCAVCTNLVVLIAVSAIELAVNVAMPLEDVIRAVQLVATRFGATWPETIQNEQAICSLLGWRRKLRGHGDAPSIP